jgi:hypothetical protein
MPRGRRPHHHSALRSAGVLTQAIIPNLRYFAGAIVELGRSRGGRVEAVKKAAICPPYDSQRFDIAAAGGPADAERLGREDGTRLRLGNAKAFL